MSKWITITSQRTMMGFTTALFAGFVSSNAGAGVIEFIDKDA